MSSSAMDCPVSGSVAAINACTSGASRVGSARHACSMSSVTLAQRRHGRARTGPRRRRQPPGCAHRTQGSVGGVGRRDVHVFGDHVVAVVQVEAEHRSAQRPHGHPPAVDVEVDFPTVRPAFAQRVGSARHVTAEVADVRLGEDRLQGPLAGQPRLVGQDEQAVARQVLHFLVHDAPLGGCVVAAQHVADPAGREHRHHRGRQPLRAELNAGDSAARVAQHLLPCVEIRYRPQQLPNRQRVLRGQRQRADVAHECQSRTSPSPCVITVPGITLSRYGTEPQCGECVGCRAVLPHRNDPRVVAHRLGAVGELVPHRFSGFVVGVPLHEALRAAGVVAGRPVAHRHLGVCSQMLPLHGAGHRGDPAEQVGAVPLPERMQDAGARAAVGVDGGDRRPHDRVGHLDEGGRYLVERGHRGLVQLRPAPPAAPSAGWAGSAGSRKRGCRRRCRSGCAPGSSSAIAA